MGKGRYRRIFEAEPRCTYKCFCLFCRVPTIPYNRNTLFIKIEYSYYWKEQYPMRVAIPPKLDFCVVQQPKSLPDSVIIESIDVQNWIKIEYTVASLWEKDIRTGEERKLVWPESYKYY